ncbi:hypothetical protein AAG906_038673 [Vitis piasezkii]
MGGGVTASVGLSNNTRRPTGNTPFALAYGMDAVIPTEIGLPTIRIEAAKQDDANAELGRNLDWADEVRETASIRMADYQQRASAHYNRKQTHPPALLFALISAAANLPFASSQWIPPSGVASPPPSKGPSHPPPHAGGHPLTPPGSLPQLNPPESLVVPERWISRPPPISSADFHFFFEAKAFI